MDLRIIQYWDDILRFIATIKLKETTASDLFRRLNSYSKQHWLYQAVKTFRRDVLWLILREAFWLVIADVAVGLPMAFAGARLASTLLFGLTPTDPVSMLLAALLMLTVAMMVGYLPARRATRVDPIVALRCE